MPLLCTTKRLESNHKNDVQNAFHSLMSVVGFALTFGIAKGSQSEVNYMILEENNPAQSGVAYAREHGDRYLSGISPRN